MARPHRTLAALRQYAETPVNYHLQGGPYPEHATAVTPFFTVTFMVTVVDGMLFRHMRLQARNALPHHAQSTVAGIGKQLGFTGPIQGWHVGLDADNEAMVFVQPINVRVQP